MPSLLDMIKENFDYYVANQSEIVGNRLGEFVVIKDRSVAGYFAEEAAAFDSVKGSELETFIVKKCQAPGTDVVTFHNRQVAFA